METQIAVSRPSTTYSLRSAVRGLPPDVSQTLFLQLVNHCRPGARQITSTDRTKLVYVARLFRKLPTAERLLLLSRAVRQGNQPTKTTPKGRLTVLDGQEQEAWIKERVSDAYSWVRDLRRLGVASASSYIFAGRRSAPQPPKDWADEVLYHHYCEELTVQDSVVKYVDKLENAFLQLPDRRWYIKFHGEAAPPLADSFGGFHCIQNLMKNNHLGSIVVKQKGALPSCVFMPPSSALKDEQQRQNFSQMLEKSDLGSCHLKSFAAMRGNQAQDEGRNPHKVIQGRSSPEAKQIFRAIQEIASHNSRVAAVLNSAISTDSLGVWSFNDPERDTWVTDIGQLPYDASMEKTQNGWLVQTPWSGESVEIPSHRKGMEYIARALQLTGVSIPVALLANGSLLDALMDRPAYQKLFKPTHQRLIRMDRFEFDEGTRTLVEAVSSARGTRGKYYEVTHVIAKESPLAKYIPTGFVSLTPEGLKGVLYLLQKRLAAATIEGDETLELAALVKDIDRAVKYVARYETLAAQIEPDSNVAADKVQKAISSAIDYFWQIGESSLGQYFDRHIKTGKLCSHAGPWLWDVRGLSSKFPDVVDLAKDHMYMKLRRLARQEGEIAQSKHHRVQ